MSKFIMWPKTIDTEFRAAYLLEVGEKIQDTPLESNDGLSYMIGSSRATDGQVTTIKNDTNVTSDPNDIKTNDGTPPVEWVPQ